MTLAYLQGATVLTSGQCSTSAPQASQGHSLGSSRGDQTLRKLTLTRTMVLCQLDAYAQASSFICP
ncbi:MAG: hypothetical protein ACI9W2_004948 [Gammaproteobacteria bacterium]|jgi:hypothetical protein